MNEIKDDAMKTVWHSQTTEVLTISAAYVRHRAAELERASRIRSLVEQSGCVLALTFCA
jgi:hypothetical protein